MICNVDSMSSDATQDCLNRIYLKDTNSQTKTYIQNTSGMIKTLLKLPDNLYVKESLALDGANITELPNNLYVGWNLYIYNTSLAKKYTDDEIREMITSKGGTIKARIIR